MKAPLPLLATLAVPLSLVGARLFAPRASIAQTPAPSPTVATKLRLPPLPSQLTPEQALEEISRDGLSMRSEREAQQLLQQGSVDWHLAAQQKRDLAFPQSGSGVATKTVHIRVFPRPPFDPATQRSYPLKARFGRDSQALPTWQGDVRLWLRLDGVDARVLPNSLTAHPPENNSGSFGNSNHPWENWHLDVNSYFLALRRNASEPWQPAKNTRWNFDAQSQLTRAELFNWNGTAWICLHVRSWGGGQWRYMLTPALTIPDYFEPTRDKPFPSNPFPAQRSLLPLRVETSAPIYGSAKLPPWPRTRYDVVSPRQPLLRSLEFFDTSSLSWKPVPKRGEPNFPLQVSSENQVPFRVVPLSPQRPWPSSPYIYPQWAATRDGVSVSRSSGTEQTFISSWGGPTLPTSNASSAPGYINTTTDSGFPQWCIRPSKNKSDLMTISVSAGNTLQTQVQVLPQPTSTPTPAPASSTFAAGDVTSESFWTRRQAPTAQGMPANDGGVLWAIQNSPGFTNTALYGVSPYVRGGYDLLGLRVVLHSRFHDGKPCGTWSATQMGKRGDGFTATFNAPRRADWGWMWAEYWNNEGTKIGRSKDQLFLVLPVGVVCRATYWKATGHPNEWSRQIHAFAGGQMPQQWLSQAAFIKALGTTHAPTYIFPVKNIPLRLQIAPPPFVDAATTPRSTLSVQAGTTAVPIISKDPVNLINLPGWLSYEAPRLVATQTVQWKLGDSNQLDSARVVAELNLPSTKGTSP